MAFAGNPFYAVSLRGQLGVVLFFVISGYCITASVYSALNSGKPVLRYFYERLRRIYPPYLFALLLTSATSLLVGFAQSHHLMAPVHHYDVLVDHSLLYWVANVVLMQYELHTGFINIVFWSLCYEVAFYAFMGLLLFSAKQAARVGTQLAGAMTVVIALGASSCASLLYLIVVGRQIFPFDLWYLFSLGGLLFFLIETTPATMAGCTEQVRKVIWVVFSLVYLTTCAFAALKALGAGDVVHPSSRVRAVTALLFCVVLILLRRYDRRITEIKALRPLFFVGSFSYSLYLIHPVVLPFVDVFLRRKGLDGSRYFITFAVQILVSVLVGRLMFLGVEQFFLSKKQSRRLTAEGVLHEVHPLTLDRIADVA